MRTARLGNEIRHTVEPGGRKTSLLASMAAVTLFVCPSISTAKEGEKPSGVVVVVGSLQGSSLARTTKELGGARWRMETLLPEKRVQAPSKDVNDTIDALRAAYLEADFLRCLATLRRPELNVDRLLENNHRQEAAQVQLWTAACAHGAGDLELARSLFEQALCQDLPIDVVLAETRPDFQHLVEKSRSTSHRGERISLMVRTRPSGAKLHVDGKLRCRRTPCKLSLWSGEHILVVNKPGYGGRTERRAIHKKTVVELTLDTASADEARVQLRELTASQGNPGSIEIARLASSAIGVPIVMIAWHQEGKGHAVLYDRSSDKLKAHVSMAGGPETVEQAVRSAAREWQLAAPKPFYRRAWFYLAVVGVAGTTALVTFWATRGETARHDIVFP